MRGLVPQGWFVPVTPGTRYVTVGGAIAADIHGKNHHARRLVRRPRPLDGAGPARRHAAHAHARTGPRARSGPPPAAWASPAWSSRPRSTCTRSRPAGCWSTPTGSPDLDDAAGLLLEGDRTLPLLGGVDRPAGHRAGRWAGRCSRRATSPRSTSLPRRGGPPRPAGLRPDVPGARRRRARPTGCSTGSAIAAFNEVWFRKAPRRRRGELQSIAPFFHPLDMVEGWNRIYGPPRASSSGSASCRSAPRTRCAEIVEALSGAPGAVVPRRAQALRRGRPRAAVVPGPGWTLALDVPAGDRRPRPAARPARPAGRRRRRPASTWPRTAACARAAAGHVPPPRRVARRARPPRPRPPPRQRPGPAPRPAGLEPLRRGQAAGRRAGRGSRGSAAAAARPPAAGRRCRAPSWPAGARAGAGRARRW